MRTFLVYRRNSLGGLIDCHEYSARNASYALKKAIRGVLPLDVKGRHVTAWQNDHQFASIPNVCQWSVERACRGASRVQQIIVQFK